MDWRQLLHRAARKADRIVCVGIGVETLGDLLYRAIQAEDLIAIAGLLAIATLARHGIHRRRRRVTRTHAGHTHTNRTGGPP